MSQLTSHDEAILRTDLERLAERSEELVEIVYARWFELDPSALRLFETHGFGNRREMLDTTLLAVHDQLEKASWVVYNVAAYGARHEGAYFVESRMYAGWIEAVVIGIRELLAADFGESNERAWRSVLERTCRAMASYHRLSDVRSALEGTPP